MIADILRLIRQIGDLEKRVDDLETELAHVHRENSRLIGEVFECSNKTH